MSLFGRRERTPKALEWGSSFAEAEVGTKSRRSLKQQRAAYDGARMANHRDQRPIGSRVQQFDGYGSIPDDERPPRRRGFLRRVLGFLLFVAALALVGGLVVLVLTSTGMVGGSSVKDGTKVQVVIPKNADANDIAGILADKGVIGNETVFRARLKLNGDGANFRSGTYSMKAGSSYDTIVRDLEKAPVAAPTFTMTIIEGQRLEQVADSIDQIRQKSIADGGSPQPVFTGKEYLAAANAAVVPAKYGAPKGTKKPEGFLFPSTYDLRLNETAAQFVARQQAAFDAAFAQVDLTRAKAGNLTPYEVVTIASLIEREAQVAKERPLVSAVIYNRLKAKMTLGIDASNQYQVWKTGSKEFWSTGLTQSQLDTESPYNLRLTQGLPPTPIAAPGLSSLQAAAAPAKVDYLYYVTKSGGNGTHVFTDNYDEFLAAQ